MAILGGDVGVVEGNVAASGTDSGAPVKVGGVFNTTLPTLTTGQRGDLQLDSRNGVLIVIKNSGGTSTAGISTPADGLAPGGSLNVTAWPEVWNGASGDRERTANVFKTVAAVSITAGTPVALWTPTSGKKFRLMGFILGLSVAGAVILKDATTEIARSGLLAAGTSIPSPPFGNGILSAAANNALNADVTATGAVTGVVFGTEE